jgi:hypothetical protein
MTLLLKLWPFALALIVGTGSWFGGYRMAVKDQPKIEIPKCPDCRCEPCNGIDFDKIKGKYITLNNTQKVEMNGDSLIIEQIRQVLHQELEDFKVKKCK